jgi:hypothetical protein
MPEVLKSAKQLLQASLPGAKIPPTTVGDAVAGAAVVGAVGAAVTSFPPHTTEGNLPWNHVASDGVSVKP